jgi:hypothetical protein
MATLAVWVPMNPKQKQEIAPQSSDLRRMVFTH